MRPQSYASGFLVFRFAPKLEFLLMKHPHRWDLPKGHLDSCESKSEAALRELEEETGIPRSGLWIDPDFEFQSQYHVRYSFSNAPLLKELTIFLALLKIECEIRLTEHVGYHWFPWSPPHRIQAQTIDPLLAQAELHLSKFTRWPPDVGPPALS
jgi:bis(5'-nucleosidyl)-tetraphosphatase